MPFAVEAEIPARLYKAVTASVLPRMNEWVSVLGDQYMTVTRTFYDADFRPELHFDDLGSLVTTDWIPETFSDLNDALQLDGFSGTSPWAT